MTEDLRPAWMKALRRLIATTPSPTPNNQVEATFGTVRSLNPLRIALDSDPLTTLSYVPPCLDYPTYVGQRVWVQTYGRQVVVIGVSRGTPDLPVGTGAIWTGMSNVAPGLPWMLAEGQALSRTGHAAAPRRRVPTSQSDAPKPARIPTHCRRMGKEDGA